MNEYLYMENHYLCYKMKLLSAQRLICFLLSRKEK